eukprot:12835018-Alexandrium_andersonii.AAC.1
MQNGSVRADIYADSMKCDAVCEQGSMQGSARDDTMQCDTHVDSMKGGNATYGQVSVQGSRQGSVRADIYVVSGEGDA